MKSRLLVAAVGVPLLLVILLACPKFVTAIALSLLCAVGSNELLHTTGILRHKRMLIYCAVMAFLVPLWCLLGAPVSAGAAGVASFGLLLFVEALFSYPNVKFESVTGALFAAVLIPLCMSSLLRILLPENGRLLVLIPIMVPFIADAGAYFAGRFFGKHKMAPVLSPHKTIEGAVGGVVTGIVSMLIYGLVMHLAFGRNYQFLWAAVIGLVGSLVSIVGDLSFSMVKRETGIKDYGTIFRAHGGVLDRFDSVIFAAPVIELMMLLLPVI